MISVCFSRLQDRIKVCPSPTKNAAVSPLTSLDMQYCNAGCECVSYSNSVSHLSMCAIDFNDYLPIET